MGRIILIVLGGALAVVLLIFAAREFSQGGDATSVDDESPTGNLRSVAVAISDGKLRPGNVSISPTQTVRWVNRSGGERSITSAPASEFQFDSGPMSPGERFEETFIETGVFPYRVRGGSSMRGTVTVLP